MKTTTIRASEDWLDRLDAWAKKHGISRMAAIHLLVNAGMLALAEPHVSAEQIEELIAKR